MSEFGRRVGSNGSYGSDHGTGGPVMMFGLGVKPGIYGTVPDMSLSNVGMQFDYRQIYANILHEWMGVDKSVIANGDERETVVTILALQEAATHFNDDFPFLIMSGYVLAFQSLEKFGREREQ
ncbi:MAG: DUF1501 domain-containing protein [Phycisphaerae bacterium]